ncbi:MAG: peptidylprolyl isomerase [Thermoguttaceae bacterium]|nr:peptidylprolyl isomerase [Thermoguttaceae bacterium]MDW8036903.1 peptidyl-prolyl cis-trans isomerase [Thermoguttaceae bacterium]
MYESHNASEVSEVDGRSGQEGVKVGLWGVLIFAELAALWVVIVVFWVWLANRLTSTGPVSRDPEKMKLAAKELEERGLAAAAAAAWQAYLDAQPQAPDRWEVLLRIGNLYLRAQQPTQAAQAFALLRQEVPDEQLKQQVEAGLVACERLSGLYGPIEKWLAQRRLQPQSIAAQGQVVAIVGDEKLTEADLDMLLRSRLDQLLAAQGLSADKAQREAQLRQWNSPGMRARLLRLLLQNDLFLRRAREMKLHEDPEFVAQREETLEMLLLERFLERELVDTAPTQADVEAYYRSHLAQFQQPEMLQVVLMQLPDAKTAAETGAKIQSAEEFVRIAASLKGANGQPAAGLRQIVRNRPDPILGDPEPLFQLQEGQWTNRPLEVRGNYYLVLVDKKIPARTLSLAEVRPVILDTLRQQRRQEALDRLFEQLSHRYGVKILLQAPATATELPLDAEQTLTEKGPSKPSPPTASIPLPPQNPTSNPKPPENSAKEP